MEPALVARCAWSDESVAAQHPSHAHTSVVVTHGIPSGTCFGPCALRGTVDSVAFIAHKCSETRHKPHVFRVDPEALSNSTLLHYWLRFIQAARNAEERNTEAFLREDQLHIRTTREVQPEEELLLWYDDALCQLLGFAEMRRDFSHDWTCARCSQAFQHEYPLLAHCRFLCPQRRPDTWRQDLPRHTEAHGISRRQHKVTDFHNIARDLEKKNKLEASVDVSPKKRKYENTFDHKSRKAVLLEKTNISNDANITTYGHLPEGSSGIDLKVKVDKSGCKKDETKLETGETSNSSAFLFISSNTQGEAKSAFCKPHKRISPLIIAPTAPPVCAEEMTDARGLMGYNLMPSSVLAGDVHSSLSSVSPSGAFRYAPEHLSRSFGTVHLHRSSPAASLTALPPTFTSFGVSVQNWCAKCNLSFRMTSDLVFHMRSHHKRDLTAEAQVRRRREEKLTCPICHEYFRERHHLSRHMTSHN